MTSHVPPTTSPGQSAPASAAPGPVGIRIRRVSAILAMVMAIIAFAGVRLVGDTDLYDISLNAAVIIASFSFFASSIQSNWPFFVGVLALLIPLGIIFFSLSEVAATGVTPEWSTYLSAAVSVTFTGLAALGPQQPHIWR